MKIEIIDCVTELFAYTYYLVEELNSTGIDFEEVKKNYSDLIGQARQCGQSAGIPKKKINDALFPVFAWIDESLLDTSWEHKQNWARNSLQKIHFNTTNAGKLFFTRLEKLSEDENDIREIYQYCLASGFRGDLYRSFQREELKTRRLALLKQITGHDKPEIPEILFPQAGNKAISGIIKRKRWKGMAGFSFILVLLPVLVFLALFYFFDKRLGDMISASGIFMS